jgi:hypothetical protein
MSIDSSDESENADDLIRTNPEDNSNENDWIPLHSLRHFAVNFRIDNGIHTRGKLPSCELRINSVSAQPSLTVFRRMESNLVWSLGVMPLLPTSNSGSDMTWNVHEKVSALRADRPSYRADQTTIQSKVDRLIDNKIIISHSSNRYYHSPNQWNDISINEATQICKRSCLRCCLQKSQRFPRYIPSIFGHFFYQNLQYSDIVNIYFNSRLMRPWVFIPCQSLSIHYWLFRLSIWKFIHLFVENRTRLDIAFRMTNQAVCS